MENLEKFFNSSDKGSGESEKSKEDLWKELVEKWENHPGTVFRRARECVSYLGEGVKAGKEEEVYIADLVANFNKYIINLPEGELRRLLERVVDEDGKKLPTELINEIVEYNSEKGFDIKGLDLGFKMLVDLKGRVYRKSYNFPYVDSSILYSFDYGFDLPNLLYMKMDKEDVVNIYSIVLGPKSDTLRRFYIAPYLSKSFGGIDFKRYSFEVRSDEIADVLKSGIVDEIIRRIIPKYVIDGLLKIKEEEKWYLGFVGEMKIGDKKYNLNLVRTEGYHDFLILEIKDNSGEIKGLQVEDNNVISKVEIELTPVLVVERFKEKEMERKYRYGGGYGNFYKGLNISDISFSSSNKPSVYSYLDGYDERIVSLEEFIRRIKLKFRNIILEYKNGLESLKKEIEKSKGIKEIYTEFNDLVNRVINKIEYVYLDRVVNLKENIRNIRYLLSSLEEEVVIEDRLENAKEIMVSILDELNNVMEKLENYRGEIEQIKPIKIHFLFIPVDLSVIGF